MSIYCEISTTDPTKIVVNGPYRFKDLIKGLPGSKYNKEQWTVPLSWQTCLALRGTFRDELTLGEELTAWATKHYAERIAPALALRDATEADGYPGLYPYQRAGVHFLSTAKRALLCDGLGSGKTFTSFAAIRNLCENLQEDVFPLLIVAPNSTKIAWKRAIEVIWPGLTVTIIAGSAAQRKKQFKEPSHVYIINWESVKSHSRLAPYGSVALKRCPECGGKDPKVKAAACEVHLKELNHIEFRAVIVDEAHRMKSASSKQTRAIKAATGDAEYRFALTGTPIANAPDDLWSILNWLYPEAYPSKTKYIDRFLSVAYNNWGAATVVGVRPEMEEEFFKGLDPILRRMPKEIVLPFLPPVVYERRDVEMSPKQKKAYEQMRDQMIADIDGELLISLSPLTRMTRLLQFAASYAEVENVTVINKETGEEEIKQNVTLSEPSATLDAFMDDIEGFGDESVVVFSPSKQMINLLAARFDKAKIRYGRITGDEEDYERQLHMDNFQDGKIQFILCTTGAGGTGVTLTRARIAVYLGRPWSGIDSEQSEGRIHRIGSEIHDKIIYRDYVTSGTVQMAVFEALTEKTHQLQTILRDADLMRKIIEENEMPEETEEPDGDDTAV